jgi:hypothetical protein
MHASAITKAIPDATGINTSIIPFRVRLRFENTAVSRQTALLPQPA